MSLTPFEYVFQMRSHFLQVVSVLSGEQGVSERHAAERHSAETLVRMATAERIYSK